MESEIMEQLGEYWPEVAEIFNGGWLPLLKIGLVSSEVYVENCLQRSFFVVASLKLKDMKEPEDLTNEELGAFVVRVQKEAALILGQVDQGSESMPSMMKDENMGWVMCSAIKERLVAILKDIKKNHGAIE